MTPETGGKPRRRAVILEKYENTYNRRTDLSNACLNTSRQRPLPVPAPPVTAEDTVGLVVEVVHVSMVIDSLVTEAFTLNKPHTPLLSQRSIQMDRVLR